ENSVSAFLARPGFRDNPEIKFGSRCAIFSPPPHPQEKKKASPEVLLWRGLETCLDLASIVSLTVSASFSSLPFSLLASSVSSVNDFSLQGCLKQGPLSPLSSN